VVPWESIALAVERRSRPELEHSMLTVAKGANAALMFFLELIVWNQV
jgi:hypothetical protein